MDHHCYTHHSHYCGRCCRLLVFNAGEYLLQFIQLTSLSDDLVSLVIVTSSHNVSPQRRHKNQLQNLNCCVHEVAVSKCYY